MHHSNWCVIGNGHFREMETIDATWLHLTRIYRRITRALNSLGTEKTWRRDCKLTTRVSHCIPEFKWRGMTGSSNCEPCIGSWIFLASSHLNLFDSLISTFQNRMGHTQHRFHRCCYWFVRQSQLVPPRQKMTIREWIKL